MGDNPKAVRTAWQPLTFHGVAAFAGATWKRLLLVQILFAVLVAAAIVWCLNTAWFPTIRQAIRQLPEQGEIRSATLDWRGDSPCTLAEGRFLAFVVDLNHSGKVRSPADIQIEPGRKTVRFISLFGIRDYPYPAGWIIACNRGEVEPWWGAWKPPILWMTFAGSAVGLLIVWTVVSLAGGLVSWLVGFFANRDVTLAGGWKIAGASLMPAAMLMTVAILAYGFGALDVVQFLSAVAAHVVVAAVYLIAAAFCRPRLDAGHGRGGPFGPTAGGSAIAPKSKNPFSKG